MLADAARRQVHHLAQRLLELGLVDLAGAVQVDIDRQRLGDADGVGELDRAAVGEAGRDDVLGEIARGIGGRAVDLGRILAGEGAAAMRRRAAIGVDDDLAAGEAAVAVRAADDELAGRVDVPDRLVGDPALRQRLADVGLDDRRGRRSDGQVLVEMLGGERRSASPRPACRSRSAPSPGSWRRGRASAASPDLRALRPAASRIWWRSRSAPASAPASRGRHSRT